MIDDGKLAGCSTSLHEGQSRTVALAMSFEALDDVFIPNSSTRSWVEMPCSFDIALTFFGNPVLSPEPVTFHVEAENWESLRIRRVVTENV